jgi:putative ABC transport system permease protein
MVKSLAIIELPQLALAFVPVLAVLFIQFKWSLPQKRTLHALVRMLAQLLLVGFFLGYIFESSSAWLVLGLLIIMVLFSSWIALNNIEAPKRKLFQKAALAISLSGCFTLLIITQGVLQLSPWYHAQTLIPLAGMVFASSMNSVSLSGERFYSELANKVSYHQARNTAFQASMIPNVNALLAVGIVSLPGMMTGQILSGVSPFIAARYQIMVMCMIFASAGISSAYFLYLTKPIIKAKVMPKNTDS